MCRKIFHYLDDEPGPWCSILTWLITVAAMAAFMLVSC